MEFNIYYSLIDECHIFIVDGKEVNSDEFLKIIKELQEKAWKYDNLCK